MQSPKSFINKSQEPLTWEENEFLVNSLHQFKALLPTPNSMMKWFFKTFMCSKTADIRLLK